ncbi:MAG: hypothetical protein FWG59_06715 [Betaproteobacteria bacterium]|nr:hypothetical protein [Betaproteobacteria bacterium]
MRHSAEHIEIHPYFDLELLMSMSQETRLGGAVTERLMRLWEQWVSEVHALRVKAGTIEYLAVWLNEKVEEDVDRAWDESPSEAYLHNSLAQVLCMSTVHGILPEIQDAGCAPAPRTTDALRAALAAEGLPYTPSGTLARRYAVVTHYPFKGGCEICNLQHACPKAQGTEEGISFLLPGYECEK